MISLTPDALSAAKTILATAKTPAEGLRIQVEAGGCSGFQYKMELETEARDGDEVVEPTAEPDLGVDFEEETALEDDAEDVPFLEDDDEDFPDDEIDVLTDDDEDPV